MLCYLDTTFCVSPTCRNACGRQLTPEIQEQARRWWKSDKPPIAVAEFCDAAGERIGFEVSRANSDGVQNERSH